MELLRTNNLALLLRRAVPWPVVYLWSWCPLWHPWQLRHRLDWPFAPEFEDLDLQELEDMIASGAIGKIVEVLDKEDNERVETYVD